MWSSSPALVRRRIPTLAASAVILLNPAFIVAQARVSQDRQAGILFYNQGKTTEAISALRSAVKQDKADGEAWYYLGLALVRVDGTVENILVVRSLPGGLTAESVEAARRIKFTPATKDGKPVSVFMELQYNFNLF